MRTPIRYVLAALAFMLPLAPLAGGCAADEAAESMDLTQSVAFQPLEVGAVAAAAGLTVLKNRADYVAFFGEEAPTVDFTKHWVVHYSMGMKATGGFSTEITAIEKTGPSNKRKLVVHTRDMSPGNDCNVTQATTNPQVAVRINKQPSTPSKKVVTEAITTSCSEVDCGELENRAVDECLFDDGPTDWESCFEDKLEDLGDVRQPAKDCCDGGGPFFWCNDYNNGNFTCAPAGGSCADEHVGCDFGQVESEDPDLTCPQVDSHSSQYCCVPE